MSNSRALGNCRVVFARWFNGSLLLVVMVFTSQLDAQLPSPRLDRLQPLGVSAGSNVEVEFQGADLEEVKTLLFDQPGLSAEPVPMKERFFKIHVAPDVPAGTYDVRLVGRFGVSNPRLFAVSKGLTDIPETEPNNEIAKAQLVTLNAAIQGTSDGNDQDWYRISLKKGQRVIIDVFAQRLDVQMDATLLLTNASGAQVAASSDYHGRDPMIDFVVPQDGEYLIGVSDLSFRGGFPYRMVISDRPHVENVFPRAVTAGKSVELTLLGRNFGPAGKPAALSLNDLPFDEGKFTLPAPAGGNELTAYRFLEHPTAHSVQPTAATCTLNGFQLRPTFESETLNAVNLLLVDGETTVEHEPNDRPDQTQAVTLPLVMNGRFDQPRDADWFEFQVSEKGTYGVEVYCERIAGQADPYMVLMDDAGNRVQELDDFGHRLNGFDGHLRDPSGTVNLEANKKYRLLVQDRYRRGGPRYQYVLQIRQAVPQFFVAGIHRENPAPAGLNLWRGGATYLELVFHQRDGYNEPIVVTVDGLPPGVHAVPTSIVSNNRGAFVLWADENAAEFTGSIRLKATGKRGTETLECEVRPYSRVWNDGSGGGGTSRPVRQLALAVREKAPFALRFEPDKVQIEAGKKAQLKVLLTRISSDFREKLTVLPIAFPGNIRMSDQEIPAGVNEVTFEVEVQAGSRPGEYTLACLGQAQVPFAKDPASKERPNLLVSLPSQPITIAVMPAAK